MKFAIDNIPSLADAMPYASYIVLHEGQSDGVPELLDGDDTLPKKPRWAPGVKVSLLDQTKRIRRTP